MTLAWRRALVAACVVAALACLVWVAMRRAIEHLGPDRTLPGFLVVRPPHETSALALDGDRIWAGGRDGVMALDRATGAVVAPLEADPPLRYVSGLAVDAAGALWIGHFDGLTRWDGTAWRTWTTADGLPDDRVNAVVLDGDGTVWVATWGGAAALRGDRFEVLRQADGLADDMVKVMLQDRAGGWWFGSAVSPRGGLAVRHHGTWQRFHPPDDLPHANVSSVFQGADGDVWVGTGFLDRGGAARFTWSGDRWVLAERRTRDDGLAGEKLRSIHQDVRGHWWFGSEYDGVLWEGEGRRVVLTRRDGLADDEVKVFLEDPDGILWLGTRDGVTRVDPGLAVPALLARAAP